MKPYSQIKKMEKQIFKSLSVTAYTVGIMFSSDFQQVILALKDKPEWQKGKYNFPGGHIESGESGMNCICREFAEECGLNTMPFDWKEIGVMNNPFQRYYVNIFSGIYRPGMGELTRMEEDLPVEWFYIQTLPENMVPNLRFLIPFAWNYWKAEDNLDRLTFGQFSYK